MMATTASEALSMLQTMPEILAGCRENIKAMRAQLDPRSDWITVTSAVDNPMVLCVLKADVVNSRRLSMEDQERVLQECVDEVSLPFLLILVISRIPYEVNACANFNSVSRMASSLPVSKLCLSRRPAPRRSRDGSYSPRSRSVSRRA